MVFKFLGEQLLVEVSSEEDHMQMWVDLVVDEDFGVAAELVFDEPLVEVGMDCGFEKPYPTIYVFFPVFGTSKFREARREFMTPVFYHVVVDVQGIDFVTGDAYCEHAYVSVTVVVEAGE